ncbi:hypothetical protein ACWIGW_40085 [Nocardia brasiliensis]
MVKLIRMGSIHWNPIPSGMPGVSGTDCRRDESFIECAQGMGSFSIEAVIEGDCELTQVSAQAVVIADEYADTAFEQLDDRELDCGRHRRIRTTRRSEFLHRCSWRRNGDRP